MTKKKIIGLIGFGVVGEGVYQLIQQNNQFDASVKKIAIKDPYKQRNVPNELITFDINDILDDPEIDIVIELIDDAEAAFQIVLNALQKGKHVISANKKMIAHHLEEIIEWQAKYPHTFLYEAAVCGSIPILQTLDTFFKHHAIHSIQGIVNGSTNYILSKQFEFGYSFEQALQQAQDAGYAESNPSLDIEGYDAINKLCILIKHGFGIHIRPNELVRKGITSIQQNDIQFAKEHGFSIKLCANAVVQNDHELLAYVLPQFVSTQHLLAHVRDENNALIIHSEWTNNQFYFGKGAGRYPTSAAVLSDLVSLLNEESYSYHQSHTNQNITLHQTQMIDVYVRCQTNKQLDTISNDFNEIYFRHNQIESPFLIGKISIQQLLHSTWLNDETISLIQIPEEEVQRIVESLEATEEVFMFI